MDIRKRISLSTIKRATDIRNFQRKKDLSKQCQKKSFISTPDLSTLPYEKIETHKDPGKLKNDVVIKDRKAVLEISENVFTDRFSPEKRTDTEGKMREERFKLNLFAINQAGFVTDRPIQWLLALELYEDQNEDINSTWYYKKDKNGRYAECEIMMVFKKSSKVTLIMSIVTGVMIAKGKMYRKWIDNDFERVRDILDTDVTKIINAKKAHENRLEMIKNIPNVNGIISQLTDEKDLKNLKQCIDVYIEERLIAFTETLESIVQNEIKKIENAFSEKLLMLREEVKELKLQETKSEEIRNNYNATEELAAAKDKIMLDMPSPEYLNEVIAMSGNIKEYCKEINNLIKKEKCTNLINDLVNENRRENDLPSDNKKEDNISRGNEKNNVLTASTTKQIPDINKDSEPTKKKDVTAASSSGAEKLTNINAKKAVDLLVCMDLNRTQLNWRNFFTQKEGNENSPNDKPSNLDNIEINKNDSSIQKGILINAEADDLERTRAKELLESLEDTIQKLRADYDDINIVFNEITVDWNKT